MLGEGDDAVESVGAEVSFGDHVKAFAGVAPVAVQKVVGLEQDPPSFAATFRFGELLRVAFGIWALEPARDGRGQEFLSREGGR